MASIYSTYRLGAVVSLKFLAIENYASKYGTVAYCRLGNARPAALVEILPDNCHPSTYCSDILAYTDSYNQAYSEYKHVLANILRSFFVARTPSEEARSPGRRSNVENAARRRPITGKPTTPTSHIRRAI